MSPKLLDQVLAGLPRVNNPNVLLGFDTSDDAGVYKLTPDCALVQTVDFFTPIVDDPYTFGAIAAANALSDVYAMGGSPISALSILAYPASGDMEDLSAILKGGADTIHSAGCAILGGHSINDEEIKFGYAVTGTVHPERFWSNGGARPGDLLFLTKPIGTGVIATALKRGTAREQDVAACVESMLQLNRAACEALLGGEVHACTDVTGFGLLGHAREMALASGATLEIDSSKVQFLPGAVEASRAGALPGGQKNNREFVSPCVMVKRKPAAELEDLLYDPQTSGGLLVALPPHEAERLRGIGYQIGMVLSKEAKPLIIL